MKLPLSIMFLAWTAIAGADNLPMPPGFSLDQKPQDVLSNYPLGVISSMAAYAHHGHPDQELILPNGLNGWIYELRSKQPATTYVQPDGTALNVQDGSAVAPSVRYTLVFGVDDKVIDVLYDDRHRQFGSNALQMQQLADVDGK